MKTGEDLKSILKRIDRRGYKAYKDIKGEYGFGRFTLVVEHVQGDPFAAPSSIIVRVPSREAGLPPESFSSPSRGVALRDYLTREFASAARRLSKGQRGSGKGGVISIDRPGQEVLERTSCFVEDGAVEARFRLGLPAIGRKVAGGEAEEMFFKEVPAIVEASLLYSSLDPEGLMRHVQTVEDADYLREKLEELGLVAFVADGAVLPRRSGIDPRPLEGARVVPFEAPESFRVCVELPNRGDITGMGIPSGITLIVGGGYHGKSTLLNALELGVYNHVPGDGREFVVATSGAVKIRAEDERRIEKVDIRPFIGNLPFGADTRAFSTENASGSTSQAANIMEALEAGCTALLIDEDTSATNFMIRDHRMQELVAKDFEPITPFLDKARTLHHDLGVSVVLVMGGSGDYFDVAGRVVCMVNYTPRDVTGTAREIAEKYKAERSPEGGDAFGTITPRAPKAGSLNPEKGRKTKIKALGTRAIGFAMSYARRYMDGERNLREVVDTVIEDIKEKGLDVVAPHPAGDFAGFRPFELASAVNRLRTLEVVQNG